MEQRVLVAHWGSSGGGTLFHYELARAWEAKETDQVFVSYSKFSDQVEVLEGLRAKRFVVKTYRSRVMLVLGLPRLFVLGVKLRTFVRKNKIDHVVTTMESIYGSLVFPIFLPRAITYGLIVHDASTHPGDEHWLKSVGRKCELKRVDYVCTLSTYVRDRFLARRRDREVSVVSAVHPAFTVPAELSSPRDVNNPVVLGFFGRLLPYKGIDLFLQAVAQLSERGELELRAEIHGQGPSSELAHTKEGENAAWFTDWVDDADVPLVLSRFDVLVLPYREASQSGVLSYAMSLGLPVVCTPVGGLSEQVEQAGIGVASADLSSDSIADAIEALMADADRYRRLSEEGVRRVFGSHSWEVLATQLALAGAKV